MTPRMAGLLCVLAVLAGYLGYIVYTKKVPCVTPIHYGIAEYDSRFGVSREELERDLAQAAQIWNDAIGTDVLVAKDTPDLPIFFQYGALKYAADTLSTLNSDIDTAKAEETKTANQYADLKKQYDVAKQEGRATQEMADELNLLLKKYYELHDQINATIAKSHRDVPQGDINEGRYVSDSQGTRIYMYGFQQQTDLMRGLTHEFGHALGLEHVGNPDSIMYPDNNSQSLTLSKEDIAELKKVCGMN